jgi:hypothetical protein
VSPAPTGPSATPPRARRRLGAGLAAALALVTAGCSSGSSAAPGCTPSDIPDHDDSTLVVEGDAWSGYAPFRDDTLLEGTGYSHVYVDQPCQDVRMADVTAGRADIAVTSLDQYLLNSPEGTIVGVIDQSLGADALLLGTVEHPELDTIDDVSALVADFEERGERPVLAYTANSPSEMLLNELANTSDELRLSDFELVSVDQSATAYEMLLADEAQLAVTWEPDTTTARNAGYAVGLDSADVPDSIVDVIVASEDLILRDPDAVQAVVGAYYDRMDTMLARPTEMAQFYAEDGGIEVAAAESLIDGIELYATGTADTFMNADVFPLDTPRIQQSLESIGSVLALVNPDITLDSARIDGRYVRAQALEHGIAAPGEAPTGAPPGGSPPDGAAPADAGTGTTATSVDGVDAEAEAADAASETDSTADGEDTP